MKSANAFSCLLASVAFAATAALAQDSAYFGGALGFGAYPGQFGILDLDTGAFSVLGNFSQVLAGFGVANGVLYGASFNTTNGALYSINPANGSLSVIGASTVNYYDFGSTTNGLFAVGKDMNLYSINSTNGAATLIGPTGLPSSVTITIGMSTAAGELYFSRGTNLYTLNTSTGAATLIGSMGGSTTVGAIVFEGGKLYGGADTPGFQVDTLDPVSGAATFGSSAGTDEPFWGLAPVPSSITLTGPHLSGTNFLFSFGTVINQTYTVQANPDLATTNWTFYTNLTGSGTLQQIVVPAQNPPQRFFRVRAP